MSAVTPLIHFACKMKLQSAFHSVLYLDAILGWQLHPATLVVLDAPCGASEYDSDAQSICLTAYEPTLDRHMQSLSIPTP